MEKSQREKLQRFSIRKLSIGAVSCLIGTVTFLGWSNNVQAAEKPQTVETAKAENEIQPESTQESKPNEEAKGDTQNVVADKNAVESQKTVDNNAVRSQKTDALTTVNQVNPKDKTPLTDSAEKESKAAITTPVKQDTTTPSNHNVANQKSNVPEQVHLKLQQKMGFAANKVLSSAENKVLLANLAENKVANDTGVTTPVKQDGAANEKLIGTGKKASVSLSDGSTLTISNNVLDDQNNSAILTFQSGSFKAGDTYQIKVPKKGHLRLDKVDVASLQQGMGTTTFADSDENYWVITDNFTSTGTVKQDIKINRYDKYYEYDNNQNLKDYLRNIYHNSIQLSKNSEEKANLNIDEIDRTHRVIVDVEDPYQSGNSLLFNNDENKIASYNVTIANEANYQALKSNDEISIISTIKNLNWAIPDKVLVNGEESKFTYDSNNLTVYINQNGGRLDFNVDVIGRVNVSTDKFDSHHKWNTTNAVDGQIKINNIEKSDSNIIKNIVIDSVQNLTFGDMFQIERTYEAGYYDNKYPTAIERNTYPVNDGLSNDSRTFDTQAAICNSGIINIQNITGKTLDNVSVDADIPDGINLTNVNLWSNIDFNEQEKPDIKTIISYTDGSSDIFNTSEVEYDDDVLNPHNNKKIKHIKLELNKFNSGLKINLGSVNSDNLSAVQKENTKIAEKYADGTPVAPGDLIIFKETISANGQKDTVDTGYLRLVDHNHDKYHLGLELYPHQSSKSPNIQDAGDVVYKILDGIKKGDSPVIYIRVPKNATLTGDKPLFRTTILINDNEPINYQLLHVGDSVFMKVHLPKNTSGSATVTVHYGTIPDGQTSEDQLAYAVSGIDTDSYIHKFDDMNNVTFADCFDGHVIYKNPEISNDFNALFKREGINLKDVAYYFSGYSNDGRKLVIDNPTWDVLTSEGISTISMTDSNMNPMPNMDSTQDVHSEHPDTFNIYGSIINATDQTIKGATQVINVPDNSDGKSQFNPVLNGPIHLIDALTGNDLSGLAEITYSTQKSDLNDPESTISGVSADQVTDWSQIKSVQVHFKDNSLPSKTSARAVLTLKDPHIYDDIGKTIYASNKAFTKDQQTGAFELLPTVIKSGSTNSAKLIVAGQAKVHTLIHYGDQYIELPDKLKTYAELNGVMQRSDFLNSDAELTDQDRALLPANIAIDYAHPTIKNSDETYVDGYNNGLAEFGKQAKYDFNNDSVVFNAQDMKLVTDNKDVTETIHYVYENGPKKGQKAAEDAVNTVTFTKTGYQNPFTGETKWANNAETKEFKAVDSPAITNYTPDSETIDAITVNQNSDNIVKTVSYKANCSNLHVIYQDDTDQQELSHQDFLNGFIGDSANYNTNDAISNYRKQHYDLVSDETNGQSLTYQDTDKTYIVHFKHHISNVDETSKSTQTVHYVASDNSAVPSDAKHEVSYSRTNQHDDVTGKITNYGTWGPMKTLPDVQTPEKKGYTPDIKEVKGAATTPGKSEDFKTTVTYTPDTQKAKVVFIDDTDHQTLKTVNKDGVTKGDSGYSTRQDIQNYENQHYVLVSDTSGGSELIFDDDDLTDQYYEVHFVHDTKKVSRNDDVNMTVHYVMDDNSVAPSDSKQTVSFTENGSQDLVTQTITWTPADSQTLNDVASPVLTGYTADIKTANGKAVNFGDPDINATVTYHANAQTAKITYIDDTTKTNLDSKDTSGKFGQAITFATAPSDEIANYKKQGYVLVSNSFDNNKYQADDNNNVFYVHFIHGTKKVSRNDDVNMTVHYVMDDNSVAPSDSKQTVSFTEDGIQDLVTKHITWTPADSQTLKDVDSPVLTGYTADIKTANGKTVNFGDPDINVTVTYHANAQTAKITYIDDTTKTNLKSKETSGKFGQAITFATAPSDEIVNYKKQGYKLVSNDFNSNKYQADNNKNVFYVHFVHDTKKVSRDHSASFTVHYIYQDGGQAKPDHEQTLSFTEDGIQDLVTQKITWTPADSQKFDDAITPVITGYTPDHDKVIGQTANFETDNREVTVTYLPNVQLGHINYIDDNTGKTLTRDDFSGRTNEHEDYTSIDRIQEFENKGYVFVSSDYPDGGFNFDDNDQQDQVFNVHLKHGIVTVTSKNPQIPNTTIDPDPHSPKYPEDISKTSSDVKRTIDYKFKDGKTAQPTVNDSLHFERTVVIDKVTGDVLSDTWTPSQDFNDVQTPVIQGYTPDKAVVSDKNIGHDHQNIVEHVIYSPDAQHMTITYIDDTTRKTLHTDNPNGVSDQDAKYTTSDTIKKYIGSHYKLVSDSTNGQDLIFDHDDNADQSYEVHFIHNTHKIDQITSPKQTVHYVYADDLARQGKAADDNVQQLSFKRDGYNDEVTGTDHWNAWTPENGNYNAVDSPVIQGYTPDKSAVEKSTVNPTDKDTEITVVYNADKQAARVIYVDQTTNAMLTSNNLSGKSDKDSGYNTKDTIEKYQSQHYVLTGDETNGDNVIFDHDDKQDQTYYVYFVHGMQKVNRQDTVTSTIDYKFEDGQIAQPTVTQTKQFSEDGVKDLVTGEITWDKAEPQKFNDVATKSIVGYTPDKDNVTGSAVNFGDKDITETVTYHNNAQKAVITYVDDMTKNTLASDSQDGKFDHEITFEHDPAEVINGLKEKGYKLVSNDFKDGTKYKADNKQNEFIVYLTHDKQKVNRQDQVIETIHYVYENGSKSQPDHEQTINFSEDGVKDLVTGQIDWTSATPQKFDDVTTPTIVGYTPDKDTVTGSTVKFGDNDIVEIVTYHNNAQKAVITYVDDTAKKTLDSDTQNGKFNHVITFEHDPANVIKGFEEKGYKLVSNDFNGDKYQADNSKNVFYVHFVHGSHDISDKKAITETITYKMSDNSKAPDKVEKQVEFSRVGKHDEVTNTDTWNKWQPDKQSFDAVSTPEVTGYTPDIKSVEAKTVTAGDKDIAVTVTYTPNKQKAKVVFIDDTTKTTLDTHNLTGVTNGHEKYSPSEEINQFVDKHYVFVSSDYPDNGFTYDNDDSKDQVFEIHLKHGTHKITDKSAITETITYRMSDGSTAPDKVEKQVEFSRDGYNDEVTKQDHWNKWQPNKQTFDAVPTPEVKGYTPDIKSVEAKTVTAGDKDIAVTVTYTPDQQKAKVVFIDDTTKKTLDTHNLTGVTNGHEKYSPSEEIEKFIHDNYVFVSSDYPEKGFTYDNDDNHDQVFEVHLKEIPTESDTPIVPGNTEDNGGSNDTPTDSDEPEKDNGGSDTDKSNHKTPVKRHDNKKHHGTKKTNNQKKVNKNHQDAKKTNSQKTSKTAKLNPNRLAQPKLEQVKESTNNVNRIKHDALPQTGEKHSSLMAMLGLAISGLGMIGAMKSKKRKDD